jgi:6-phosphogluconolactonase (cycloisomerase 2 family)
MSNPSWSIATSPWGLQIFGGFMYVVDRNNGVIRKINMSDGSVVNEAWSIILEPVDFVVLNFLVIDATGTYMYVSHDFADEYNEFYISQIDMSDGSVVNASWAKLSSNPKQMYIDSTGTFMYVSSYISGKIVKINMWDGSIANANWVSVPKCMGLVVDSTSTFMYVGSDRNPIKKIRISTGVVINTNWGFTGYVDPQFLAIDATDTYMYVSQRVGNKIVKLNMSDGSIATATYLSGQNIVGPTGIAIDNNFLYVLNYGKYNGMNIGKYLLTPATTTAVVCFKKDTKILTHTGYRPIQDLRKGDLIKTLSRGYKPIDMIGKKTIEHNALSERISNQLYQCSKSEFPELFEPLVITGCHSILVDEITCKYEEMKAIEILGKICTTEKKFCLPAAANQRTSVYKTPGTYEIYHLALENEYSFMKYGIYANGLLVESCSKKALKEYTQMTFI